MSEPISYAFTNIGVFDSFDGVNFTVNTTANAMLSSLGNCVVVSSNNIVIGNSTNFNTINSTAWTGTANNPVATSVVYGNSTVNVSVNSTSVLVTNSSTNTVITSSSVAINNVPIVGTVIGEIIWTATTRVPANFLRPNGSSLSRTTFASLFNVLVFSSAVSFTNGSSNITWNNHGLSISDKVKFYTSGTLPTNFTAGTAGYNVGTEYFVVSITTNTFQVSATPGGAAITAGSTGSGTQTAVNAPWGDGDGSTTFTLPNLVGEFIRSWDSGGAVDIRAFGTEQLDAMQGHKHSDTGNAIISAGSGPEATSSASAFRFVTPGSVGVGTPTGDGTNGTPRTASETRPRNQALQTLIRYQ